MVGETSVVMLAICFLFKSISREELVVPWFCDSFSVTILDLLIGIIVLTSCKRKDMCADEETSIYSFYLRVTIELYGSGESSDKYTNR